MRCKYIKNNFKRIIGHFARVPGTLFLLDGLGAALTTFSLYFILRPYYDYMGIPPSPLTYLSGISLVYCAYSVSCYSLLEHHWTRYLRILSIANILYCFVTIAFLYSYYIELTPIACAYFLAEILIVGLLAYLELRVAHVLRMSKIN